MFGGGRKKFMLETSQDPGNANETGERKDLDLVEVKGWIPIVNIPHNTEK